MRELVTATMIAMVACGGARTSDTGGSSEADTTRADRCKSDVADLDLWMAELLAQGVELTLGRYGIDMVRVSADADVKPLTRRPAVTIGTEVITFNGEMMAEIASVAALPDGAVIEELHERLLAERKAQCIVAPDLDAGLTLHIDQRATWRSIRAVTDTIYASRYDRVLWAFEGPVVVTPPAHSAEITSAIETWEAQVFDSAIDAPPATAPHPVEVAWGDCDALIEATEKLGPDDRATLLQALPAALESCDCAVSADNVKAIVWWWSGRDDGHRAVGIDTTLAATGRNRRVVGGDDAATWGDAHHLISGSGPIVLATLGGALAVVPSRVDDTCESATESSSP
jgi:hypothetical protein